MISCGRFAPGDRVMYGARGVCLVSGVGPSPCGGDGVYYKLNPIFVQHGETIYAPVSGSVKMRGLISAAEAEQYIAGASGYEPVNDADERMVKQALRDLDCQLLMSVLKGICLKNREFARHGRKPHETERKMAERAGAIVYGELAAVLEQSPEEIRLRCETEFQKNE